jgi:hypothetical protein
MGGLIVGMSDWFLRLFLLAQCREVGSVDNLLYSVANCSFETFLEFSGLCLDLWLRCLPLLKREIGSGRD